MFADDPGTLNLTAQAGGQINLLSYANLNAISVVGGGTESTDEPDDLDKVLAARAAAIANRR